MCLGADKKMAVLQAFNFSLATMATVLICFVTLPHCMQTSSRFWGGVGFQLGQLVDAKEHKQATLRSVLDLPGNIDHWVVGRATPIQ